MCKAWFKRGRGLNIHQSKSGCRKVLQEPQRKSHKSLAENIPEPHHSGVHSQVFPIKAAQRTGDGKELANKEVGKQLERKEEVEDKEKETEHRSEQNEKQGHKGKKEAQGKPPETKGNTLEEQGMNVHIEQELYMDIQAWLKGEVGSARVDDMRGNKKSMNIKKETKQPCQKDPDIRCWFNKPNEVKPNTSGKSNGKNETTHETNRDMSRKGDTRTVVKAGERRVITRQKFIDKEEGQCGIKEVETNCEEKQREIQKKQTELKEGGLKKGVNQPGQKNPDIRCWLKKQNKVKSNTSWINYGKDETTHETNRGISRNGDTRTVVKSEGRRVIARQKFIDNEDSQSNIKEEIETKKQAESKEGGLKKVVRDIHRGNANEVIATNLLNLTKGDFRSLSKKNYVNDKIVDDYMSLIQKRNAADERLPDVYTVTVFLYKKLQAHGLEEGMRQTQSWFKEDLREKDLIMFPVHEGQHWSLVVVDTKRKSVDYYDSIRGSRKSSPAPRILKTFIENYYRLKGQEVQFSTKRQEVPIQTNGVDCGVFTCQYAERAARRVFIEFTQKDIDHIRVVMMEELVEGRIFTERERKQNVTVAEKEPKKERKGKERRNPKATVKVEENGKSASGRRERKERAEKGKDEGKEKVDTENQRKPKINWPSANSKEWAELDRDLTELLKRLYAPPKRMAETHPGIIYAICKERFGVKKEKAKHQTGGPSKRQRKCTKLREDINTLKKTYKNAPEEEKEAIQQLQEDKIKELRLAKRAETMRKNRKKYSKNCSDFLRQPFDFAREVIAPKPKGVLRNTKEEVETYLGKTHGDSGGEEGGEIPDDLWEYSSPEVMFNNEPPSFGEFRKRLERTRAKSAPGPNGVPYLVYKRCPGVARLLWRYLKEMWSRNEISVTWRRAEGVFIPKEDGATAVEKYRTISLLNVEGKLYFAMKADRLLNFTLANKYIDTSVQKGGIPKVSGCLEHTAILSHLIKEAKEKKKNLVITWLDIANAYGSIPHSLIITALRRAHVPEEVCELVKTYYADVKIRFTTADFTTEWQQLEKGIITGCTISVILFALTMTMLVLSVKGETKGPKTESGQQQESCRLFMDDIASTTETLVQTRYLLDKLTDKLKWAGLTVKPEKCRSLVVIKGEISERTPCIEGVPITSIKEKSVKYLGKRYTKEMNEQEQTEEVLKELKSSLKKVERCRVPGKYKSWMLQHMILPRLMWPLTIYNIPWTKVELMQSEITKALKRWLGLPKSLSVECLYSRTGKLQLPYTELTEEVKAAKARLLTTLEESEDPCVRGAGVNVDGGRKADTPGSVKVAKSRLKMQEITGIPNQGREGLGLTPKKYYSTSSKKDQRAMIVDTVRESEEDRRRVRIANLAKQGASTRWQVPERRLNQRDIINMPEERFKFLVKSVYDLLPTPDNKNTWFGTEESCKLCGGKGTITHILSGCEVALAQGRYKWRHDQVLRELAQCIEEKRKSSNKSPRDTRQGIVFVREGEKKSQQSKQEPRSYLDGASDWRLMVDLENSLKVPKQVAETNLRPDILLISDSSRKMGVVELTVPSEERIELSGELKKTKYSILQEDGKKNKWDVQVWAVEVGCRGFPASSLASFLKEIGVQGGERKRMLNRMGEAAERASRSVWRWSHFKEWGKHS